jgi:hypothetical protein
VALWPEVQDLMQRLTSREGKYAIIKLPSGEAEKY